MPKQQPLDKVIENEKKRKKGKKKISNPKSVPIKKCVVEYIAKPGM